MISYSLKILLVGKFPRGIRTIDLLLHGARSYPLAHQDRREAARLIRSNFVIDSCKVKCALFKIIIRTNQIKMDADRY